MATEVRLRRGTSAEHASFTGAQAEVTVDTTTNTLRVHDGATPGGHPVATVVGVQEGFNAIADATDPEKGAGVVGFLQEGTGAVGRTLGEKVRESVSVRDFGAVGDGITDDAAAINAAAYAVSQRGGGTVIFPPGVYMVGRHESTTDSGAQHLSLRLRDNVRFVGSGVGSTVIKSLPAADAHVFYGFQVDNAGVSNLTIDGNRDNQAIQVPSTGNDPAGVILIGAVSRIRISRLYIKDTPDYGIGFQGNAVATECLIEDVVFEDTGGDAIDSKDSGGASSSVIRNVFVRGLRPSAGQATQQAAINVRDGWVIDGFFITRLSGDETGIRINQGPPDGRRVAISNGQIIGGSADTTIGLALDSRETMVTNVYVQSVNIGVLIRQRENQISNVYVQNVGDGIYFASNTPSFPTAATDNQITGFIVRSANRGVVVGSNCNNNRLISGVVQGASTPAADNGVGTVIQHVRGVKTSNRVQSDQIPLGEEGPFSASIPHGLAFTPQAHQCQISVIGASHNDWSLGHIEIDGTDGTYVTVKGSITSASSNPAATARIAISVRVKD